MSPLDQLKSIVLKLTPAPLPVSLEQEKDIFVNSNDEDALQIKTYKGRVYQVIFWDTVKIDDEIFYSSVLLHDDTLSKIFGPCRVVNLEKRLVINKLGMKLNLSRTCISILRCIK